MRVAGVTANQFVRITVIAILGILAFKLLAAKSGIQGLQQVAGSI